MSNQDICTRMHHKIRPVLCALAVSAAALTSFPAAAHMPYLYAVGEVAARGGMVSLESSYVETYFVPEVAFNNGNFEVITPEGEKKSPDRVEVWKARTLAEHRVGSTPGTWRFSTGHRHGAKFRTWEVDGKRKTSRDPNEAMPEGAKLISSFQSLSMAETYLTVAKPNRTALAPRAQGLEIEAISHPTDIYVGEGFKFRILFDGKPLPEHDISFTEAVSLSGEKPQVFKLKTNAAGEADFVPDRPAHWVALVRFRTPAPADAGVLEYSHTYTLTLRSLSQ